MMGKRAGDTKPADGGDAEDFVPLPLAADLPAGTVVGEYTIECKLGDGGMATVYGATHPLIGKKAAIKVMNPALSVDAGLVERFILEARAVNEIGHPNIVDVFSFGRLTDGRSYFVMEWLQGMTLYDRMWERKPALDEALDILDQVCDALDAAHEKGIIHRDLKPANIFLCPVRGRREAVKLLDFGVAKLTRAVESLDGHGPVARPQTKTGFVVGTPEYIAPEQARAKEVDGKADVYALGVIAYEMILGKRPFEADNVADLVRMHLVDKPPAPKSLWPEIPSPLAELLLSMIAKEASKRPSAAQVRAVIRELRGTPVPIEWDGSQTAPSPALAPTSPASPMPVAVSSPMMSPASQPLPPARQLRWQAAGLAVVGCAAALLATFIFRAHRANTTPTENEARSAETVAAGEAAKADVTPRPEATAAKVEVAAVPTPAAPAATPSTVEPSHRRHEGTVVVRVDASDARIEIDGRLIAQSASGARVRVEAGEHAVAVTAPGRHPFRSHIAVGAEAVVDVPVRLRRAGGAAAAEAPAAAANPARKPDKPEKRDRRNDPDYLVDPFGVPK
jgi:serine/threonine-protein kinase